MHLQRECVLVAKTCTAQRAINSIPFSTPLWSASAPFLTALVPIWSKSITDLNCPKMADDALKGHVALGLRLRHPSQVLHYLQVLLHPVLLNFQDLVK